MSAEELRAKTIDELSDMIDQLSKESFNLRFQKSSGQLENTAQVRNVRRNIAQIKTILGQKTREDKK